MTDRTAEILSLLNQNRLSPALARLKLWLRKEPEATQAWHLLGVVHLHREDYQAAETALSRALELRPADSYARNNRALALLRLGRSTDSRRDAEAAVKQQPDEAGFWANLGYACEALRDFAAMADAFAQADALSGGDPEFILAGASARRQVGNLVGAEADLKRLPAHGDLAIDIERLLLALSLGDTARIKYAETACGRDLVATAGALAEEGLYESAQRLYRAHLCRHPEDASVRYLADALSGQVDKNANPYYVEALFDDAAERFDERLLGRLGYQAPDWLARHLPLLAPANCVWDLGCGTGLAGAEVRSAWPQARCIGFDLSAGMLAQAEHKGDYDALHQVDIQNPDFINALLLAEQTPDLVLLMDVLIYLPGASEWLAAMMERLPAGCRWVITLEDGPHERIHNGARIQHDADALKAALPDHDCLIDERAVLRYERGQPVGGRWLVLQSR